MRFEPWNLWLAVQLANHCNIAPRWCKCRRNLVNLTDYTYSISCSILLTSHSSGRVVFLPTCQTAVIAVKHSTKVDHLHADWVLVQNASLLLSGLLFPEYYCRWLPSIIASNTSVHSYTSLASQLMDLLCHFWSGCHLRPRLHLRKLAKMFCGFVCIIVRSVFLLLYISSYRYITDTQKIMYRTSWNKNLKIVPFLSSLKILLLCC